MSQINSLLNFFALVALIASAVFLGANSTPAIAPLDNHQFLAELQKSDTVLVKFGAKWCSPCGKIDDELDQLASSSESNVSVLKVDIDENEALAHQYRISSIPHLILFKNGKQVGALTGYHRRDELQSWIMKTQ